MFRGCILVLQNKKDEKESDAQCVLIATTKQEGEKGKRCSVGTYWYYKTDEEGEDGGRGGGGEIYYKNLSRNQC